MNEAEVLLQRANEALASFRFDFALAELRQIQISMLPPLMGVDVLATQGRVLYALGREEESILLYREALFIYASLGLLTRKNATPEHIQIAQELAIGARDKATVKNLLAFQFGRLFKDSYEIAISPVVDIQEWCASKGVTTESLNISPESGQSWSLTLQAAEIVSGWDFVVTQNGEVLVGANYMPIEIVFGFMPHCFHRATMQVAHVWPSQCMEMDVDALFLSTPESHHYGHWITDFLPRLRALIQQNGQKRKVVISAALPQKHRDMLARFGLNFEDLIACDLGCRYKFRSLQVVKAGSDTDIHPESIRFVHKAFTKTSAYSSPALHKRRLFLVRDIGTRLPANEAELDKLLEYYRIEKVNPAKWSLEEQEKALSQTELIVGVYGTELLCLFHLRPGSHVVELTLDQPDSPIFGPMSAILGLNHHIVRCAVAESSQLARRKVDRDIVVDCDRLGQALHSFLAV